MTTFERLQQFIERDMKMSQVYQPVMLLELLANSGKVSTRAIAQAILNRDPTQIEYFSSVVKNMVGRVLTKNRGVTSKDGENYHLLGFQELSPTQIQFLIELCHNRIAEFENARDGSHWDHRRRGYRPISGSIRYEVLSRAKFRCELCGVSADDRGLEVDHIHPKSLGGKDDLSNFQALCYSCNAAKRNTDSSDFRKNSEFFDSRESGCLFCDLQTKDKQRIIAENHLAYVIEDGFPVTEGHTLFIPKRHVEDYFGLTRAEVQAINQLMTSRKESLQLADKLIAGFNIGMNCGDVAGQTVFHCHVHLIPRRQGDVENPRGGVRHLIPGKGHY